MKTRRFLIAVCLWCVFGVFLNLANAQGVVALPSGVVLELPPGAVLPPELRAATAATTTTATTATNASTAEATPEQQRLQQLLALKFDRSPAAILDALTARLERSSADSPAASDTPLPDLNSSGSSTNEVEKFKHDVVLGDWAAVGQFLGTLTNDHGKQVYRHLLRELPNASQVARGRSPSGAPMPSNPNQPGPGMLAAPALVPQDVLSVAAIAPHDLEDEDVRLLGQVLQRLLARGDALEPFLEALERGVRGLGGSAPSDRRRAAELLVAAGKIIEAEPFLLSIESARASKDWPALDLHARRLLALGKKEQESEILSRAWEVNQFILSQPKSAVTNPEPALRRAFELIPLITKETGTNWLRATFQSDPGQGMNLLAAVLQVVQDGFSNHNVQERQKNLELQKQVVEAFLDVADPAQSHWRAALNLLAQAWMQEGTYSKQRHQPRRNYGTQYDQYGNVLYYDMPQPYQTGNQLPPIPAERVLESAPGEAWLAQLNDSVSLAVRALVCELYLKAEKTEEALLCLEILAPRQPDTAANLAREFLQIWARLRNPMQSPSASRYVTSGGQVVYLGSSSMSGPAISLTRAMQMRNIRELSRVLDRLEALKLPTLDERVLVSAFSAAHSPAEVFRTEDIEAVFGSVSEMKLETLAGLAQTMRERLANQWRQSRVQQQAKTQRNDKQIEAEVLRGYEVVMGLISDGLQRKPDHWQLTLARAAALFDLAEFQYGKKVDLAIYVEKRDEAFDTFERAARLYAAALASIPEKEETPQVFHQWFNANLGASDLSYVTRQQDPEAGQLQRIRNAILELPGPAAERHLAAFAKTLSQSAVSLRPELKPRYLRAGLSIVGDHPDAEDARKLVTYYDDLLNEVEFVVTVDGDAEVGHTRPFGVFVLLRHTAEIEREGGGFGRYLRSQNSSPYYYSSPYGQPSRNFITEFDQQVREKLIDQFDIKTITFLDEKVQSRGYGRPGWRETPLAYLLLQAKDGAVDRIPALRMDLDFTDSRGAVVLPVESQITLIDSRSDRVEPRPVADVELTQILDDREVSEGLLTLEIKAVGKGLVPELPELVRTNFAGLEIEEVTDHGLTLASIDTEGDRVAAVSERNWLLKLRVPDDAPRSLAFKFPEAIRDDTKMVYKQYSDADLVEVEPAVAIAGLALRPRPVWPWFVVGAAALAAVGGGIWWRRRVKPGEAQIRSAYRLPEPLTPFGVIGLLRRIDNDSSLALSETNRAELSMAIRQLETHYFGRDRNGNPDPDLAGIGSRWVHMAGNGH